MFKFCNFNFLHKFCSRDRWDYYQDYLSSCFELLKLQQKTNQAIEQNKEENAVGNEETATALMNVLDDCHEFLCQVS